MSEFTTSKAKSLIEDSHNLIYEVEVNPRRDRRTYKKMGFWKTQRDRDDFISVVIAPVLARLSYVHILIIW